MVSQTDPDDFSRAFSSIKPKALPQRHKSSFFYWPINVLNSPPYSLNWLFITQNLAGAIQYPHNKDSVKLWGAAWMLLSKIYALNTFVWTSRSLCEISNSGLALVAAWVSGRWVEERETVTRNALGGCNQGIRRDSVTTARTPGEGQEYQGAQDQEY